MPNPFPILFLSMLAHFILRVVVGTVFIFAGLDHINRRYDFRSFRGVGVWFGVILALFEIGIGLMFVAGWYTQIAALGAIFYSLFLLIAVGGFGSTLFHSRTTYWLLLGASLSLIITGAGAFARDLPI